MHLFIKVSFWHVWAGETSVAPDHESKPEFDKYLQIQDIYKSLEHDSPKIHSQQLCLHSAWAGTQQGRDMSHRLQAE